MNQECEGAPLDFSRAGLARDRQPDSIADSARFRRARRRACSGRACRAVSADTNGCATVRRRRPVDPDVADRRRPTAIAAAMRAMRSGDATHFALPVSDLRQACRASADIALLRASVISAGCAAVEQRLRTEPDRELREIRVARHAPAPVHTERAVRLAIHHIVAHRPRVARHARADAVIGQAAARERLRRRRRRRGAAPPRP